MSLDMLGAKSLGEEQKPSWFSAPMPMWAKYLAGGLVTVMVGHIVYAIVQDNKNREPVQRSAKDRENYLKRYDVWRERRSKQNLKDIMDARTKMGLDNDWAKKYLV